ncbi:hypothetical protein RF55_10504 [Lasius niger]|uniref:Uncharacterized protein n=1 Tax=Lasius niger TaxID=67767 RepID=A0A0J7KHW0_LASNI|nr:hypothetical protein RF55_10504 [Lasius niger]
MAESENPYVNEMSLPKGTAFFAKGTVPDGQLPPYVEVDCQATTLEGYTGLDGNNCPGNFVAQVVELTLHGFNALQAITLRSRMIRYGLLAQNFGVANSPAIQDDLLKSALRDPEDENAPNTPVLLDLPVKTISFNLNYWQDNDKTPDGKQIRHANVTWSDK